MPRSDSHRSLDKAVRRAPDNEIPMDRRLLHPATQEEIKDRVAAYAEQVGRRGRMKWFPSLGNGQSARPMRTDQTVDALTDDDGERVLPHPSNHSPHTGNTTPFH
jgi:hypothetical protein